jgi:hypothetical protein
MSCQTGLAPLLLSVAELIRQLLEAQILRRMDTGRLTPDQIEQAGASLQAIEAQILRVCEVLEIDPEELNLDLGDFGKLLPQRGTYYPDCPAPQASVLELLDRLVTTGVVLDGEVDLGLAQLDLIKLKLRLVLTTDAD